MLRTEDTHGCTTTVLLFMEIPLEDGRADWKLGDLVVHTSIPLPAVMVTKMPYITIGMEVRTTAPQWLYCPTKRSALELQIRHIYWMSTVQFVRERVGCDKVAIMAGITRHMAAGGLCRTQHGFGHITAKLCIPVPGESAPTTCLTDRYMAVHRGITVMEHTTSQLLTIQARLRFCWLTAVESNPRMPQVQTVFSQWSF